MRRARYFALGLFAAVSLSIALFSQQPPYPQDQQPPEGSQQQDDSFDPDSVNRGVARLSMMNGDVSIRRGDSGEFVAAAMNAPLVAGDRVLTGPNSRAEVQFDWANVIRIAENSEIRLADLADRRYQIQIAHGMATFRVLRQSEADVELSTPQVSVRPKGEGVYKLLVGDNGESSEITVRAGEVDVFTPRGTETVRAGQAMQVRGSGTDPEFQIVAAMGEDEWDRWNRNRDQDLLQTASYSYVNQDAYGAEDLDNYGQWVNDPSYGNVWAPRVAAGWAPYQEGRWVWIDWYGWSWLSYDPWGWAPYHYGRWFQSANHGWCWYPGARVGRRYWSPGLVAFVGFGGGGGRFNRIGWVPLGPHERYDRWYGRNYYGGNRGFGNVVSNANIHNTYRNARVSNGISTIEASRFGHGGGARPWRSSDGDIQRASLVRGQLPVSPGRESLRLTDRDPRPGIASRSSGTERFVSRRAPTQVNRVPFEQQRRGFEQNASGFNRGPQTNSGGAPWRRFGDASTGVSSAPPSRAQRSPGFGQPSSGSARGIYQSQPQASQSAPGSNNGWRRFEGQQRSAPNRVTESPRVNENPRGNSNSFGRPGGDAYRNRAPESVRISPPVVRERPSMSRPEAPRQQSAPSFRSSPTPRSEAPRPSFNSGGGGGSRPSGGGGGGGRPSGGGGGGGGRPSGGGGGHSGGGHGGGRR